MWIWLVPSTHWQEKFKEPDSGPRNLRPALCIHCGIQSVVKRKIWKAAKLKIKHLVDDKPRPEPQLTGLKITSGLAIGLLLKSYY